MCRRWRGRGDFQRLEPGGSWSGIIACFITDHHDGIDDYHGHDHQFHLHHDPYHGRLWKDKPGQEQAGRKHKDTL